MQLGSTAHHAIFHIGHDHGTIGGAFRSVALDKAVIEEAMEAVVATYRIKPQQVVAKQRQLFVLAERSHIAETGTRLEGILV